MSTRRSVTAAAAACWIAAAVAYLATEAIAAAGFPGYSYATNYISDLGTPASPRDWIMNTGFVLDGLLFTVAALLTPWPDRSALRRVFLALAVAHGVGIVVVALVHSDHSGPVHGIGAALAIVGGNLTAIAAGLLVRRTDAQVGRLFLALGTVGLVSIVALVLGAGPEGTWERTSVYTVTAFELAMGALLLARLRPSQPAARFAGTGDAPIAPDDRTTP